MPIYEYKCEQCEHVFEEWQKDFAERSVECPQCGAASQRLISSTAFILKGSGWYVTDYARNGNGQNGTTGKNGDTAKSDSQAQKSESAATSDSGTAKTKDSGTAASDSKTSSAATDS